MDRGGTCTDVTADFKLLSRVHGLYKRLVNHMTHSGLGISLSQASALLHLSQNAEASFQDLAILLGCGTSRISRLVNELETLGLVRTWRSDADRRALQLSLTSDGATLAGHVPTVFSEAEHHMLSTLSGEERRRFRELLVRFVADVDRFCT